MRLGQDGEWASSLNPALQFPHLQNGDRRSVFRQGSELLSPGLLSRPASVFTGAGSQSSRGLPIAGLSAPARAGAPDSK